MTSIDLLKIAINARLDLGNTSLCVEACAPGEYCVSWIPEGGDGRYFTFARMSAPTIANASTEADRCVAEIARQLADEWRAYIDGIESGSID